MKIQQTREVKEPVVKIETDLETGEMRITFEESCQHCGGHGCGRHGSNRANPKCNGGDVTHECEDLAGLADLIGASETNAFLRTLQRKILAIVGPLPKPMERGGPYDR